MKSTVIALGNGFDIGLGLKTKYNQFLNSKIFKYNNNGYKLFEHLCSVKDINGWVDFEYEIYMYSKTKPDPTIFKQELQELCHVFNKYLTSLDVNDIDEQSHAFKFLGRHISMGNGKNKTIILNFNFTGAARHIIDLVKQRLGIDFNHNYKLIHVHGSTYDSDLIFGVSDEADVEKEYHFIKKSANRSYKANNVHQILEYAGSLYCYGLSLGESDYTYFSDYVPNHLEVNDPHKKFMIYNIEDAFDEIHYHLGTLSYNNLSKLRGALNYEFIDVASDEIDWALPANGRISSHK
jgi:hypothetical protein